MSEHHIHEATQTIHESCASIMRFTLLSALNGSLSDDRKRDIRTRIDIILKSLEKL